MRTSFPTVVAALLLAACADSTATTAPGPTNGGDDAHAVASITVNAPGSSLAIGQTEQLSASAVAVNGAPVPGVTFTWSSDRPTVARVDATGVVTALGPGTARVTATAGGKSGGADLTVSAGAPPVAGIAYIRREQIRIINSDGTGDRLLWSSPEGPPGSQFVWPVRGLTWRPDGTELAFASDHEAAYSWFGFDIYALRADGGIRRLTNAPARADFASYPKGKVTVTVTTTVYNALPFQVYVMGAPHAISVQLIPGETRVITFDSVADLGNTVQPVVGIYGEKRWIAPSAPDVQAGKTVDGGKLILDANSYNSGFGAAAPLWRSDASNVSFVLMSKCTMGYVTDPPATGPSLHAILDPTVFNGLCTYDRGPTAATAGKILLASGLGDDRSSRVYLVDEGSSALPPPLLTFDNNNDIHDIRWLPDGSGFILAMRDGIMDEDVNLYEYDFPAGPLRKITDFNVPWHYLRSFSLSPDGTRIVYEWTTDEIYGLSGPADLYIMNRDGSNATRLVEDASFPAWSPARP